MKRILVTGASGFIGSLLVRRLLDAGFALNLAARGAKAATPIGGDAQYFAVGAVGPQTDWRCALSGCDAVVHLAAKVHQPAATEQEYDVVNNVGTARLGGVDSWDSQV